LFISYLFHNKFAPTTISTYLSIIGYVHIILYFVDPTQSFLVQKLINGAHRLTSSFDPRLLITIDILNKLVDSVNSVTFDPLEQLLFKALFLFACSAFARVGELVTAIQVI